MTKAERIKKLLKGIASDLTPEEAKQSMRDKITELEYEGSAKEREDLEKQKEQREKAELEMLRIHKEDEREMLEIQKEKKKLKIELPHENFLADNKIDKKSLPLEIKRKMNGLKMFMGRDTEAIRKKAPEISNNIIEMIKKHLAPPAPPPLPKKEYTEEEKQAMLEKYQSHREKKKQSTNSI